ncbi:MAG: hypothetical protein ACM3WT_09280, partial [Bacillota bacterium]
QRMVGADSLCYLSLDSLLASVGGRGTEAHSHCTACFTGDYPVDVNGATGKSALEESFFGACAGEANGR